MSLSGKRVSFKNFSQGITMKVILDYKQIDLEEAAKIYLLSSRTMGKFSRLSWYYTFAYPKVMIAFGISLLLFVIAAMFFMVKLFAYFNVILVVAFYAVLGGLGAGVGAQAMINATFGRKKSLNNLQKQYAGTVQSEVTITPEHIFSKHAHGEGRVEWLSITRARYTKTCLVLYLGEITNVIFAKKFFSESEWTELLELVAAKVPDTCYVNL